MQDQDLIVATLESCARRRDERREFLRTAALASASVTFLAGCDGGGADPVPPVVVVPPPPPPPSGVTDADILNFALNLEYLEAQFYFYAAFGTPLPANITTGTGTQGTVTGGRQVTFTDPLVAQYAREIAMDERAHVEFLRAQLGAAAVAQPPIDVGTAPTGAFSSAARAAGLIGAGASFDVYANDENFLLGAFIFEDVGVTAYKGAAPLITSKTFLEAAAGILAAEAYHAGLIRTVLYAKGLPAPSLRTATDAISNARDSLDGPSDLDQGVSSNGNTSNIVPTDGNAIAFSRTTGQVLNIAYLTRTATDRGGFFPAGVNGNIRLSAAS